MFISFDGKTAIFDRIPLPLLFMTHVTNERALRCFRGVLKKGCCSGGGGLLPEPPGPSAKVFAQAVLGVQHNL